MQEMSFCRRALLLLVTLTATAATCRDAGRVDTHVCPRRSCAIDATEAFFCEWADCAAVPTDLCASVVTIVMDNNDVRAVPPLEYPALEILDLHGNFIQSVAPAAFRGLPELRRLHLQLNNLKEIEQGFWSGLGNLKQLSLDRNPIATVGAGAFAGLATLEDLSLKNCAIRFFHDEAFAGLRMLKKLHLQGNKLAAVSRSYFADFHFLQVLELQHNELTHLQNDVFLDLLDNLLHLDLSDNKIATVEPTAFDGLDELLLIDLSRNRIDQLHQLQFSSLMMLETLHLDGNQFETIEPDVFPPSLQELTAVNCPKLRAVLPGALSKLRYLDTLVLRENLNFRRLHPGSLPNKRTDSLRTLDLSNNALETLNSSLVDWANIIDLQLAGNQWRCDCLLAWVGNTSISAASKQEIRCFYPEAHRGRVLTSLPPEALPCVPSPPRFLHPRFFGSALLLVIVFVLVLVAYFLFRCRHAVFPCCFQVPGRYSALYSKTEDGGCGEIYRNNSVRLPNGQFVEAEMREPTEV